MSGCGASRGSILSAGCREELSLPCVSKQLLAFGIRVNSHRVARIAPSTPALSCLHFGQSHGREWQAGRTMGLRSGIAIPVKPEWAHVIAAPTMPSLLVRCQNKQWGSYPTSQGRKSSGAGLLGCGACCLGSPERRLEHLIHLIPCSMAKSSAARSAPVWQPETIFSMVTIRSKHDVINNCRCHMIAHSLRRVELGRDQSRSLGSRARTTSLSS